MLDVIRAFEHAGLLVQVVQDDDYDATNPFTSQDNAGTIYSWDRDFDGDKRIYQPDTINGRPYALADAEETISEWFAEEYDAVLTLKLRYEDYGSRGSRLHFWGDDDDANAVICFTQKEIDAEWHGSVDDATRYAKARVGEIDKWLQGYICGIVIRERSPEDPDDDEAADGEMLESVWGFIADPWDTDDWEWVQQEGRELAEGEAEAIEHERKLAFEAACRDVVTV